MPETAAVMQATSLPQSPHHILSSQTAAMPVVAAAASVSGPIATSPDQLTKLQSELDIVSMNMTILSEMLSELKPGEEDPSDYKLLTDLTQTCK